MSTTARKRISIYDYPEHLNPFSENHPNNFPVPEIRHRSFGGDKYRKNSTWSSKISKKLNRSVSWIEKSWLATDNTSRRPYESKAYETKTYENKICKELQNNALYARQNQTHNNLIRRESYTDIRHEVNPFPDQKVVNGVSCARSKSIENIDKCDTRRRKKRPAPLPPSRTTQSVATVTNTLKETPTVNVNSKTETKEEVDNKTSKNEENSITNSTNEPLNSNTEQTEISTEELQESDTDGDNVSKNRQYENQSDQVENDFKNLTIEENTKQGEEETNVPEESSNELSDEVSKCVEHANINTEQSDQKKVVSETEKNSRSITETKDDNEQQNHAPTNDEAKN